MQIETRITFVISSLGHKVVLKQDADGENKEIKLINLNTEAGDVDIDRLIIDVKMSEEWDNKAGAKDFDDVTAIVYAIDKYEPLVSNTYTANQGIKLYGSAGNDIFDIGLENGTSQNHTYGGAGDDFLNMSFSLGIDFDGQPADFNNGHHVRGDADGSVIRGSDTFAFSDMGNLTSSQVVLGRIQDFDASRDRIIVDGVIIHDPASGGARLQDLSASPNGTQIGSVSVKIIEWNGGHNDTASDTGFDRDPTPQQWLMIQNADGGIILYALEGARVDITGDGNSRHGAQEAHFVPMDDFDDLVASIPSGDLWDLPAVSYIDPRNDIPADIDLSVFDNVHVDYNVGTDTPFEHNGSGRLFATKIVGASGRDAIAGGLNDDFIEGKAGKDSIWGGSGHDYIKGGDGHDYIEGNLGDDEIIAGRGNDRAHGGHGNDKIYGWRGNDALYGEAGDDYVTGDQGHDTVGGGEGNDWVYGGSGNDVVRGGGGVDFVIGGTGKDSMWGDYQGGANGADTFIFSAGHLISRNDVAGDVTKLDLINDFELGVDKLWFKSNTNVDNLGELSAWKVVLDGDVHFVVDVKATQEAVLLNVADDTTWAQLMNDDNFIFG